MAEGGFDTNRMGEDLKRFMAGGQIYDKMPPAYYEYLQTGRTSFEIPDSDKEKVRDLDRTPTTQYLEEQIRGLGRQLITQLNWIDQNFSLHPNGRSSRFPAAAFSNAVNISRVFQEMGLRLLALSGTEDERQTVFDNTGLGNTKNIRKK